MGLVKQNCSPQNHQLKTYNLKLTGYYFLLFTSYCLLYTSHTFAQKKEKKQRSQRVEVPSSDLVYDDINYLPEIKTVAFYNLKKVQSFPLLNLGGGDELLLSFDDLRGGSRNLYYSVVHCNADWTPSSISPIEYLESFSEDRVNDYRFSYNTYQKYTHYELKLPNFSVIPKLSGNYLLKVFEDGDATKLLLTRRFYLLNTKVAVQAEIAPSATVSNRDSNQKINFSIFHPSLNIQNAYQEITAVVLQNGRTDIFQNTQRPLFIRNNQLIYADNSTTDFKAGNEFRRFDTRSFRYKSDGVYQIIQDSIYTVNLFADIDKSKSSYTYQFDEDGNFYTLNQDGNDPRYDADYGNVNFVLKAEAPDEQGFAYVVGKFTAYQKNNSNRMVYNAERKEFTLTTLLKQGVVDYQYVWVDKNGKLIDANAFEGSYYQTENDYQILIYYRAPGARFDQLVSFTELNSTKNPRNF
ncbi:type IX secretion system plug protein [Pedobacter arcticus]|uniref:type IX secretion system plug protein n=1 Tax=Pedobacter arcticus TaxID=752140 RepID=UPI0002DCD608|nr:DUF5103 domain-containing protein [Pedobacter arcticus]